MILKVIIALGAFLTLSAGMTSCEQATPPGVTLPYAPAHYASCFTKLTKLPISNLNRAQVVVLVAELRKSELSKSRCGRDLLNWYDTVRVAYSKKK